MRATLFLAIAFSLTFGCSENGSSSLDASLQRDANGADVTSVDARADAAPAEDAAIEDAAPIDSGELDAGLGDTGTTTTSTGGDVSWSPIHNNPTIVPEDPDTDFGGVAVDYFLQYTVVLPAPNVPPAELRVTICSHRASAMMPSCTTRLESPAVEGDGGYRWGFDPSQYDVGVNRFWHILQLIQNAVVIDEARLDFRVTATH